MDFIDRRTLVCRHNPVLLSFEPASPLSVGNGEFAFTADSTGLQSFPELYDSSVKLSTQSHLKGSAERSYCGVPLCTQSQWGWHTFPLPEGLSISDFQMELFDVHGRKVGYPTNEKGQEELYSWLRQNPHRLNLGRLGLRLRGRSDGRLLTPRDFTDIVQTLDLWTGILDSRFCVEGERVVVATCCHPQIDMVAAGINSRLVERGQLEIELAFPYGSPHKDMVTADWSSPERHKTFILGRTGDTVDLQRQLDQDQYFVRFAWRGEADLNNRERILLFCGRINPPDVSSFKLLSLPQEWPTPYPPQSRRFQRALNTGSGSGPPAAPLQWKAAAISAPQSWSGASYCRNTSQRFSVRVHCHRRKQG